MLACWLARNERINTTRQQDGTDMDMEMDISARRALSSRRHCH